MCCWFWCTKTSKGEGSIHPNTQRVHVTSFILLLIGSYSGKTHVVTAEMISVLSCYLWCIIPSTWGKCSRDTSGMKYFSLQREEIWEEYLKCEMILRIDIFNWAYMSYGNMKMLIYDSSKLTTGQKPLSKVYIEDAQQKVMWWSLNIYSGLITAEKIRGLSCYFGVIIVLLVFELHTMRLSASLLLLGEVVSWWWVSKLSKATKV